MSYWQSILSVFAAIKNYFTTKVVLSGLVAVYCFFFNVAFSNVMEALLVLVIFDMITAVWGAKVRGEQIESRKMAKSALKLTVYCLTVSASHFTDLTIGLQSLSLNLEIGMMGFWASTELISILENVGKLGYSTPTKLINMLREYAPTPGTTTSSNTHTEVTHTSDVHTETPPPVV